MLSISATLDKLVMSQLHQHGRYQLIIVMNELICHQSSSFVGLSLMVTGLSDSSVITNRPTFCQSSLTCHLVNSHHQQASLSPVITNISNSHQSSPICRPIITNLIPQSLVITNHHHYNDDNINYNNNNSTNNKKNNNNKKKDKEKEKEKNRQIQ